MHSYRLASISLTMLGGTPYMLTEPSLQGSLSAPNVLKALEPGTVPTTLRATNTVHHTWGNTVDVGGDRENLPCVVAGVGAGAN